MQSVGKNSPRGKSEKISENEMRGMGDPERRNLQQIRGCREEIEIGAIENMGLFRERFWKYRARDL